VLLFSSNFLFRLPIHSFVYNFPWSSAEVNYNYMQELRLFTLESRRGFPVFFCS
jgi:hypothetical protein